jgi:hypothetical protein
MTTHALDFPLGRPLIPAATLRRWRRLPPDAQALVAAGDQVRADQPLADIPRPGGSAPVLAGLSGWVLEVAPGRGVLLHGTATAVTGLLGLGGTVVAPLAFLPRGESLAVAPIPPGSIIIFPQRLPLTLLQRAAAAGAAGVVAASAAALELEAFARTDLTALLDGLVPGGDRFPLPLLLTEGLGDLPMDPTLAQLLAQHVGQVVMLSGATQPRRNLRPELLLPLAPGTNGTPPPVDSSIVPGAKVHVAAGQLRGAHGEVLALFAHQQIGPQGILAPSAEVRLDDGGTYALPLGVLDRIG